VVSEKQRKKVSSQKMEDKIKRLESDLQKAREDMSVLAQLAKNLADQLEFPTFFRECVHQGMVYVCIGIPNYIPNQEDAISEVQFPIYENTLLTTGAHSLRRNTKAHFISETCDTLTEEELKSQQRMQQVEVIKHYLRFSQPSGTAMNHVPIQ
jgi:hypothetical protein